MIVKITWLISALFFSLEIIFSIYYSSEILNQNLIFNQQLDTFHQLQIKQQDLELTLSNNTSIKHISQQINSQNLQPIHDTLIIPDE